MGAVIITTYEETEDEYDEDGILVSAGERITHVTEYCYCNDCGTFSIGYISGDWSKVIFWFLLLTVPALIGVVVIYNFAFNFCSSVFWLLLAVSLIPIWREKRKFDNSKYVCGDCGKEWEEDRFDKLNRKDYKVPSDKLPTRTYTLR